MVCAYPIHVDSLATSHTPRSCRPRWIVSNARGNENDGLGPREDWGCLGLLIARRSRDERPNGYNDNDASPGDNSNEPTMLIG